MPTTVDGYVHELHERLKAVLEARGGSVEQLLNVPDAVELLVSSSTLPKTPNKLAELIGKVWTSGKVRDELGVPTRQALQARREAGSVLGVKASDGSVYFPLSQFRREGRETVVKPAMQAMFRVLRDHDPWAVVVLLQTPSPKLDERTPVDWEREHGDAAAERLQALAHQVNGEWSRGR